MLTGLSCLTMVGLWQAGTADQLKDRLGGDVLEVVVVSQTDLGRAFALLAPLGDEGPLVEPDLKKISLRVTGRAHALVAAGRNSRMPASDSRTWIFGAPRSTTSSLFHRRIDHSRSRCGRCAL